MREISIGGVIVKKRILCGTAAALCLLAGTAQADVTAVRNGSQLNVNDEWGYYLDVYNIGGSNYYKLRDIVCIMNGWNVPIGLEYNQSANRIDIITGGVYRIIGTELHSTSRKATVSAQESDIQVYVDGKQMSFDAYEIDGSTYFKLRDLAEPIGFDVQYNASTGQVAIYPDNNGFKLLEHMNNTYGTNLTPADAPKDTTPQFDTTTKGMDIKTALNQAPLNPQKTKLDDLNQAIEQFMAEHFTPDMDTYTKAKVTYDYIIKNMTYGTPDFAFDNSPESNAGYMFLTHRGVCDHYSAFFAAIMRYVGLDMHIVNGSTHAASGGMTGHTWTTARINGLDYVFDPQIDQNIGGKSNPTYYRFGKPYSELPGKYEPYVYNDFE